MTYIVRGRIFFMVFRGDPYSIFYYSTSTNVTYFTFWKNEPLQAMGMILEFMLLSKKKSQLQVQ